jgi:uncharacterized ubiquitin-like protein YukD
MIPVQITLQYVRAGVKESRRVKLSMDWTVEQVVCALVEELDLPLEAGDGQYTYQLLRQRQTLAATAKLFEQGVQDGDILQLVASDANATMLGKVGSPNILNRLGTKRSDELLPTKAALDTPDGKVSFPLQHVRALIGRADANMGYPPESLDADLTALDPGRSVSRPHALIVYSNGEFTIRDLYSQLGVLINGVRMPVNKAQPLKDKDRIAFGNVELIFCCE